MSEQPVAMREPGGPAGGMLCPVCGVVLVMAEKQGVEIDYCPKCRGIWLDRGEIEKIIERSLDQLGGRGNDRAAPYPQAPGYPPQPSHPQAQGWAGGHEGGGHHGSHGSYDKHRRKSWLREIFD